MAEIALEGVTKEFADGTRAVSAVDLEIADGEFVVLVGPSGCGKTTLLRLLAGLERATEGTIRIGDRVVNSVPAKQRDIAMVFQNYALYPHMSLYDNMAFSLKLRKKPKAEIDQRVSAAARVLGLLDQVEKRPRNISGGQRQRVAMGRAMVREPQAFLMDEPLSNLDAKLRVQMRAEIGRLQKDLGVTTVYVTHDQTEAMTLGDQVALMRHGVIQQLGDPLDLYRRPVNLFVAGFIGSPAMNLVEADVVAGDRGVEVAFGDQRLSLDGNVLMDRPALRDYDGRSVVLGIRPEGIEDAALVDDVRPGLRMAAVCELREQLGPETHLHFSVAAPPVLTDDIRELVDDTDGGAAEQIATEVESRRTRFIARVGEDSTVTEGSRFEVCIDTRHLYFFDLETGEAIYA